MCRKRNCRSSKWAKSSKKISIRANQRDPASFIWLGGFVISSAAFIFWLGANWPGFFAIDTYYTLESAQSWNFVDWGSYLYTLYFAIFAWLGVGQVGLMQILALSAITSFIFFWFLKQRVSPWIVATAFAAFVFSPVIGISNVYFMYDWPSAWLHVLLAVAVGVIVWLRRNRDFQFEFKHLLSLAVLTSLTVKFKSDTIPVLLATPAALYWGARLDRRRLLQYAAMTIMAWIFLATLLGWCLGVTKNPAYRLTLVLNPLAFIAANVPAAEFEQDRPVIEKLVDFDRLVIDRSDYEIPVFHNGGIKSASVADQNAFLWTSTKIFARYPGLFLENRWRMFKATMGFNTRYFSRALEDPDEELIKRREKLGVEFKPWYPSWNVLSETIIANTLHKAGPHRWFFGSLLPALLLMALALGLFPWFPSAGWASLTILVRLPMTALTAPANTFKYFYGTYFFMFFLVLLMALDRRGCQKNFSNS